MVNIEKVLKHDALFPHPIGFENTLGGALGSYDIWQESDLETHCHDHLVITIEVGFLIVGHTHEYIDGTYGRMSSNLKSKYIYSLLEMMDTYRTIEEK